MSKTRKIKVCVLLIQDPITRETVDVKTYGNLSTLAEKTGLKYGRVRKRINETGYYTENGFDVRPISPEKGEPMAITVLIRDLERGERKNATTD